MKYTTISVRKEIVTQLNKVKEELGAKSLTETIETLIGIYKELKAKKFVKEVKKLRETDLSDLKEEIIKLRRLRWAKL